MSGSSTVISTQAGAGTPSPSSEKLELRLARRLTLLRTCFHRLRFDRIFHELEKLSGIDDTSLAELIRAQWAGFSLHRKGELAGGPGGFDAAAALLDRARRQLRVKASRFHQQPCTVQTALARAALIKSKVKPGSQIACLGDDDFISIALASRLSEPITVLDLDQNVLSIIRDLAAQKSYPISVRLADLTKPLPTQFDRAFDIVFTDPPYDFDQMVAFLTAAESVLKRSSESNSYLMFCCSTPLIRKHRAAFLRWAESKDLTLEAVAEGFNEYPKTRRARLLSKAMRVLCLGCSTARDVLGLPHVYSDLVILSARAK